MSRGPCRLRSASIVKNIVTAVRCPCKVDKYEGLMILCEDCGFWQHGPCYTIIDVQYVPKKHCCSNCADLPSKCTDPSICLSNSNMVQASCLYRRTLVHLYMRKGRMTPSRIARLLDVDIAIGSSIIDKLLSEKILKIGKSKLSFIIDRNILLNFAFPRYLNKVTQLDSINTGVNTTSLFGKDKSISNDESIGEDIVEINQHSLTGDSENKIQNISEDIKDKSLKIELKSPQPLLKNFQSILDSGHENESNERKVVNIDQETIAKEAYASNVATGKHVMGLNERSLPSVSDTEKDIKEMVVKMETVMADSQLSLHIDGNSDMTLDSSAENCLKKSKVDNISPEASGKKSKTLNPRNRKKTVVQEKINEKWPLEGLKQHKCSFCNNIFSRKNNLAVHISKIHSQVYQCPKCEFSIDDKKKYTTHEYTHTCKDLQGNTNEKLPTFKKQSKIECSFCNQYFCRKGNLTVHINKIHSQVYQCPQCEFSVNDKNKYMLHVSSHTSNVLQEMYLSPERLQQLKEECECSYCHHIFTRRSNLIVHIEKIHSQVYKCSLCEFSINDKNKYLNHVSSHTQCSQCEKTFVNRHKLAAHILCVHDKVKKFKCKLCDFISATQGNLNCHVRAVHQKLKPFKCTLCVLSFKKKDHLKNHIVSVHQEEKPLKCAHCDFAASHLRNLSAHILTVHTDGGVQRPFKCNICTKSYSLKWQLRNHISTIHDKSKFKCLLCPFVTGYKKNLDRHFRIFHEKPKAHKCSSCRYSFDEENDLRTHVSDYHGKVKKVFPCDECGFAFKYSSSLQKHIRRTHLKCRPFRCDECGYTFFDKSSLQCHIQAVHLKEYKCTHCEYTCHGERELFVHKNAVHEKIDPYQCDDCGYVSNYKWNVICHMRSAHDK